MNEAEEAENELLKTFNKIATSPKFNKLSFTEAMDQRGSLRTNGLSSVEKSIVGNINRT